MEQGAVPSVLVVDSPPGRAYSLGDEEPPLRGLLEVFGPVFKRITLFLLTNFAILIAIGVILALLRAFGVFDAAQALGGSYATLFIWSAVIGFTGSFISLFISKWMAKRATGAQVITSPRNEVERWLVDTVARHANRAGIKMPEVAVYDAPEMNAFATGPSRNNSLVAVSTGLMQQMKRDEVDAVLGHEIAHVANGDMVTLTLIQGVLNTFVFFFSRIIGNLVDSMLRGRDDDNRGPGIGYWVATIFAEIVLGILAMIIVQWFSRRREFRADEGGASLAGRDSMINALRRLSRSEPSHLPDSMAAFGITPKRASGLMALFSSHPPIEERIARLQQSPV